MCSIESTMSSQRAHETGVRSPNTLSFSTSTEYTVQNCSLSTLESTNISFPLISQLADPPRTSAPKHLMLPLIRFDHTPMSRVYTDYIYDDERYRLDTSSR